MTIKIKRFLGLLTFLWASGLLAGCAGAGGEAVASADVVAALSGEADAAFARALAPRPLTFPRDHGAHPDYRTEWWYFTGNLTGEQGNAYGYQLTIFRSALTPDAPERASDLATNQVYMAHFAVTDGAAQTHHSFERFSRGAGGLAGAEGEPRFSVWLEDWSVQQQEEGALYLRAAATTEAGAPVAIDLTLRETRPPVLHGDAGLSQKGPEPGNASYYYSLIGLMTSGTVTVGDQATSVRGVSWMDHEFGTSALSENALGWDWISLQLDPVEAGLALMLARIRTEGGGALDEFDGTLVRPDGTQETIHLADFTLEALDEWTSPRSGITYPSGWRLSLPAYELALELQPLVRDQEMAVSFVYWEGAVTVTGSHAGQPVTGQGYVELTGYGSRADQDYQR
ncbi:MAG TPA: lipocalin-like domain-containing protein [Caldilineaceae bacterium]|nr:lipocalin-like domain-containing protein [Caldilineaceae bacterium]